MLEFALSKKEDCDVRHGKRPKDSPQKSLDGIRLTIKPKDHGGTGGFIRLVYTCLGRVDINGGIRRQTSGLAVCI